MNIVYADDLRVASKASLYTPPIEETMGVIGNSIANIGNLLTNTNSQLLQQAVEFARYYTSDAVLDQIADVRNQGGFSHNPNTVLYSGDITNLTDFHKEILFHNEFIQEAVQDGDIQGFGYSLHEPLHDTALYQNIVGNIATPDQDCVLHVDSSDYDFDSADLENINDLLDDALAKILKDDDITDDR